MLVVVLGETDVDLPPVNILTLLASEASTAHAHPVDGINILSSQYQLLLKRRWLWLGLWCIEY